MEWLKEKLLEVERKSWRVKELNINGHQYQIYLPKHHQSRYDIIGETTKRVSAEELDQLLINNIKELIISMIPPKYKHLVVMTYAEYIYKKPKVHALPLNISPYILCLYTRKPKFVP